MPSTANEDWERIAASVRIALEKRIPDMAAMEPCELVEFVKACTDAEELEGRAELREQHLDNVRRQMEKTWS